MGHGRHGIRIRWTRRRRLESLIPGQVVWLSMVRDTGNDSRSCTVIDVSRAIEALVMRHPLQVILSREIPEHLLCVRLDVLHRSERGVAFRLD